MIRIIGECARHAGIWILVLAVFMIVRVETAFAQAGIRGRVQRQLTPGRQAETRREPTEPEANTVAEEDLQKIDDAETIEELIDLGKLFVLSRKLDAAAECVEEIIAREPALLED